MPSSDSALQVEKYVSENQRFWWSKHGDTSHDDNLKTRQLHSQIDRLIAALDETLSGQVNAIIHHPRFKKLEASWRQLRMLSDMCPQDQSVILKVMSVSWKELARDAERAADFDQSKLFNFIYSQEFDMPGGQPFGLLIGDYEVTSGINTEYGTDDVATLESVSTVAAAAFSPFICSAAPALLDVQKFAELDREVDMAYLKSLEENVKWTSLRKMQDTRFVGITCPRVLVRLPYKPNDINRYDGFCFRETVEPDASTLLWGSSAYAMAMVVMREYMISGWFADIRGIRYADEAGGTVDMYPKLEFPTDKHQIAAQPPVEIRFTPTQEQMLADFGIIPLMPLPYSVDLVFNTNQSLHLPQRRTTEIANLNARIAAMLQYVLCACRFAHYLKQIMRQQVGQVMTVDSLRTMLNTWLGQYCIGNDDAESEMKARFPLRTAYVDVKEIVGKPGVYSCIMQLQPHFQLDDVKASFQLLADMNSAQSGGNKTAENNK